MKKFLNILLLIAIVLAGAGLIFIGILFYSQAEYYATFPELIHMRYPILILCYLMLAFLLLALVIAFVLVLKSTAKNIFEKSTVQGLTLMGHAFGLAFLSILATTIYSYVQLGAGVGLMGVYLLGACFLCFAAALVMYFIANLFAKAVEFKEENDWTV